MLKKQVAVIFAMEAVKCAPSATPAVLEEILFDPILHRVASACRRAGADKICVVTDCQTDLLRNVLEDDIEIIFLDQPLTLSSLLHAEVFLHRHESADAVLLNGDTPFIESVLLKDALLQHQDEQNTATLITAQTANSEKSRRTVSNAAYPAISDEICGGWFDVRALLSALVQAEKCGCWEEAAFPNMILELFQKAEKAGVFSSIDPHAASRPTSLRRLSELNETARKNRLFELMDLGVLIPCMDGLIVGQNVQIGAGTTLLPGTILRGNTKIGENCTIGPNSLIEDSTVGDNTTLNAVQCYRSSVGCKVSIGPFCHIRPNTTIRDGVHIGDFVELKNSDIGQNTHIAHLTYVGDSDVGARVNFGCGVAVANYDGVHKYRCTIGDDAFIGCNTNLVAPVNIGSEGYTAAGSTITEDVPDEAMGIARARQVNKPGYNRLLRRKKAAK